MDMGTAKLKPATKVKVKVEKKVEKKVKVNMRELWIVCGIVVVLGVMTLIGTW